jgi:dTMP kinase
MRLIIVDGLDGVGKDTHAKLIKDRYEEMGEKVALRSHPESDNFFGKKARKALFGKGKINKLKASVFYMVDVLRSIRKYYEKKEYDTLIMVRYLMGTAYLPQRLAKIAYDLFENFVPTSDYMFFLDASPTKLLKRFEERDELEMFETLDELVKVRKKALILAESWNIIDTTGTVEATFSHIENVLEKIDNKT